MLTVPTDDVELVRAQFRAFARQIPLLYFILATNALAVMSTFAKFGHPWLSIYAPSALCLLCLVRGIAWWRIGRTENVPDDIAILHMQRTNRLAFFIAVAFTAWGLTLFSYGEGDAYAEAQIVFFLALTMISCNFCLMHLRSAALNVTLVGVAPFSLFFFFADDGHFRAAAVNLALAAIGMIAILMIYYRDFAHLVASRRSLLEKQAETQRLSDENSRLANIDSLSGLPNRRALMTHLDERSGRHGADALPTAVVYIDLDGFKDVNDTYGHATGDRLIDIVAKQFGHVLPRGAMLARVGGDEFAAVISARDAERAARAFAARALEVLGRPVRIGDRAVQIGASVGICCTEPDGCDAQELFRRADIAMYHVKANGKSGVSIYSPDLDLERQRQQDIEDQLRRALRADELEVVYQPIVDAVGKRVVAVEALLRWPRRPEGELPPDQFVPVAERSGLINQLGLFVLRRACEDFLAIDAVKVAVNVSPAQFRDPDFELAVMKILMQTGFPAARLELEVTEGYLIDHPQRAAGVISFLKTLGVAVALDDFGAGYTSIAYLQKYGFDRIKLDKSLVDRVTTDRAAGVLVAGAIHLANGLDMAVTAEGVETEEQAYVLGLAGCQRLQGFLFGRPMSLEAFLDSAAAAPAVSAA
ncbi:EAL domain-containing protein [Methylosinus sp. H3A]|uniref:putative bifunctional diguanylate cyclase/phosphodiesterase n=1 Tax=Methylosinus sp. H3A TaxID=2785786 RepID=UPI0018C2FFC4|nr:EAL domain-containing protein [Methylosinus sp. H3A]MBG0808730.1 EAL domain-containing protein [Methylosinus sp. H3A]